jgi:hypothetical protein
MLALGERSKPDIGSEMPSDDLDQRVRVDGAEKRVLPFVGAITWRIGPRGAEPPHMADSRW